MHLFKDQNQKNTQDASIHLPVHLFPEPFPAVDAHLHESLIHTHSAYRGRFLHICHDEVLLPNQKTAGREYVLHPGASMIIPLLNDKECLLEYQYRRALGRVIIEFPAGKCDAKESPLHAAKRELLEETGYKAKNWHPLGVLHPLAAYSNESIHYYIAQELEFDKVQLDEGEYVQTFAFPIQALPKAVEDGHITDAKTIIGIYRLQAFLNLLV